MPSGVYKRSDAIRKHLSEVKTGIPMHPNTRAALLKANTGRIKTKEEIEKAANAHRGIPLSEDHKRKLSKAHKGIPMHPNTRNAIIESLIGNKHTLGMKMSKEFCAKVSKRLLGNKINIGKKHTEEWKNMMSEKFRGEKSYMWKGGITPINQQIRTSRKYKNWERSIVGRDKVCQKCSSGSKLMAHHILNFWSYIDKRFDMDNGITFCRTCHKWFHHIYGIKYNNLEQVLIFTKEKYERKKTNNNGDSDNITR